MKEKTENVILVVWISALVLFASCGAVGTMMYNVGVQDGTLLAESPTIRSGWSILDTNTTIYNITWYFISVFSNNSVDVLPTLTNDTWFVIGSYRYVQGNNTNNYCNFTLTIPKIENSGNITIERISVLFTSYSSYTFIKSYDIFGGTETPTELNIMNGCAIAIWGYGSITDSVFGNDFVHIPEFKLSNFVLFSK